MNMNIKSLTFLLTVGLSLPSMALDLSTSYELALKHDIKYQLEESNLIAAKTGLPQAESGFKPQFSAQARGNAFDNVNDPSASVSQTSIDASLNYSQVLYNEQNSVNSDIANASIHQAEHALAAAKNDLIIRTADAYFSILSAQDNLNFAQIEKRSIARQLEQAEKRFEVGLTAVTDVKEAGARFDSAVAQELVSQNQYDISQQNLELITGPVNIESIKGIDSALDLQMPNPASEQYWMEQAEKNNADVLTAQANLAIAAANRKKATKADGMTINASGSYALTTKDNSITGDNNGRELSLGIVLNYPLSTGGRNEAFLAEKEAQYQRAKDAIILQKRISGQQARSLYLSVISGISQIKALKQASDSSQVALEATNAGFEVGTRTSVDVLTAIKDAYRAKRDESSARYQYLLNMLKLKQAAGILSVEDLISTDQFIIQ